MLQESQIMFWQLRMDTGNCCSHGRQACGYAYSISSVYPDGQIITFPFACWAGYHAERERWVEAPAVPLEQVFLKT